MTESKVLARCRLALVTIVAAGLTGDAAAYHPPHNYRQSAPAHRYCPPGVSPYAPGVPGAPGVPTPADGMGPGSLGAPDSATGRDNAGTGADQQATQQAQPQAQSQAPSNVASAPASAAPSMIGDHFGNGYRFVGGGDLSLQGGIRRMKIAENVSPMPQDRVFFSFNHFADSVRSSDPGTPVIDIQRYTVGVERTFFDGLGSVEIRAPFVDGLNADQTAGGPDNEAVEFGDITITPKVLLASDCCYKLSAGMGIQLPTADDASFGTVLVENTAVHLKPFLGLMVTPNSRAFAIAYAQVDVDVSGYDLSSGVLTDEFSDPVFLYLDVQYGYWVYRSCGCCCAGGVTGIAPVVELHYATNLDEFDEPAFGVARDAAHVDILNLTAGVKVRFGCNTSLTVAAATPLTDDDNRNFDWEMITQLQYGF